MIKKRKSVETKKKEREVSGREAGKRKRQKKEEMKGKGWKAIKTVGRRK